MAAFWHSCKMAARKVKRSISTIFRKNRDCEQSIYIGLITWKSVIGSSQLQQTGSAGDVFVNVIPRLFHFQIDSLQRSLSDARENSTRLSSTIESLMTSHSELQEAMERLQVDMGQKDSELNILRRDKWVSCSLWSQNLPSTRAGSLDFNTGYWERERRMMGREISRLLFPSLPSARLSSIMNLM